MIKGKTILEECARRHYLGLYPSILKTDHGIYYVQSFTPEEFYSLSDWSTPLFCPDIKVVEAKSRYTGVIWTAPNTHTTLIGYIAINYPNYDLRGICNNQFVILVQKENKGDVVNKVKVITREAQQDSIKSGDILLVGTNAYLVSELRIGKSVLLTNLTTGATRELTAALPYPSGKESISEIIQGNLFSYDKVIRNPEITIKEM